MNKQALKEAEEKLLKHAGTEPVRRFAAVFAARAEVLRDQLEKEESETVRGELRACRYFIKLLSE